MAECKSRKYGLGNTAVQTSLGGVLVPVGRSHGAPVSRNGKRKRDAKAAARKPLPRRHTVVSAPEIQLEQLSASPGSGGMTTAEALTVSMLAAAWMSVGSTAGQCWGPS